MSRIQTDIFDGDIGVKLEKFVESNNSTYRVMTGGGSYTDMDWQIHLEIGVVHAKIVECVSKVAYAKVAVPSKRSFRILVVTRTLFIRL
ncbi:MAG: hypothetical protein IJ083_10905, partial [Clostridia bacterium]|nr:hypothetical protein [Clostridia bacterium]